LKGWGPVGCRGERGAWRFESSWSGREKGVPFDDLGHNGLAALKKVVPSDIGLDTSR
jgi:hypothetical protein